jgi:hypothetical protein
MSSGITASEMIKRFRDSEPTSREQREKDLKRQGKGEKMWWEDSNNRKPQRPLFEEEEDNDSIPVPRSSLRNKGFLSSSIRSIDDDPNSWIDKEIRNLERNVNQNERKGSNFLSISQRRQFDDSFDERPFRDSIKFDDRLNRSQNSAINLNQMTRKSTDTLSNTGVLALLNADLKLDGRFGKGDEAGVEEKKIGDLNSSLEAMLKSLKQNQDINSQDHDLTIPEITNRLETGMIDLIGHFNLKENRDKESASAQEKLKEEGREEERKKILLAKLDEPVSSIHPDMFLSHFLSGPVASEPKSGTAQLKVGFGNDPSIIKENMRILNNESIQLLQRAMDNEISSADEIFHQMRNLRTQVDQNLKRLQHGVARQVGAVYRSSRNRPSGFQLNRDEEFENEEYDIYSSPRKTEKEQQTLDIQLSYPAIAKTANTIIVSLNSAMEVLENRLPSRKEHIEEYKLSEADKKKAVLFELSKQSEKAISAGKVAVAELKEKENLQPTAKSEPSLSILKTLLYLNYFFIKVTRGRKK